MGICSARATLLLRRLERVFTSRGNWFRVNAIPVMENRDLKIQDGSKDDGRQEVDFPHNACALETLFVYMDCVTPSCFVDYGKNTILALWFLCALFHCFSL